MTEHDEVIMTELKYIRDDLKEVKQDVKEIQKNCACRLKNCSLNFITTRTFWYVVVGVCAYATTLFGLDYIVK